jgi:phage terminase small subunit
MTLADGDGSPADRIPEILAGLTDSDRAALAVYCNAWSSYTDLLTAPSRTATVMELAA